jgi:hypothetical protein
MQLRPKRRVRLLDGPDCFHNGQRRCLMIGVPVYYARGVNVIRADVPEGRRNVLHHRRAIVRTVYALKVIMIVRR